MVYKNFINKNKDNILEDIATGETIPAIDILKRSIIINFLDINRKEALLMYNKRLNNNVVNPRYLIDFSNSIISLFNLVKGMAITKNILNNGWVKKESVLYVDSDFYLMERLERGDKLSVNQTIRLKNYLMFVLHKLKLTNLLIEVDIDIEQSLKEEF